VVLLDHDHDPPDPTDPTAHLDLLSERFPSAALLPAKP
jgi:hypothetical protein